MPIRVQVSGTESLSRKLQALQRVTRGQMLEKAVVAGALIVQNAAKQRAPYRTGNLRRSIHIGGHSDLASDFGGSSAGQIEGPVINDTRVEVFVGTNVEYARQREFGGTITPRNGRFLTFQVGAKNSRRWVRVRSVNQRAQPYLRPAIDENGAAVRREIGEALQELIRAAIR